MIFAIRVIPRYADVFKELYLTSNDIVTVINKHANLYTDNESIIYMPPDKLDKIDPLGCRGYLGWESEPSDLENENFLKWVSRWDEDCEHGSIYPCSPELKDAFDYKALGLQKLIDECNNKDYYNN